MKYYSEERIYINNQYEPTKEIDIYRKNKLIYKWKVAGDDVDTTMNLIELKRQYRYNNRIQPDMKKHFSFAVVDDAGNIYYNAGINQTPPQAQLNAYKQLKKQLEKQPTLIVGDVCPAGTTGKKIKYKYSIEIIKWID